MNVVLAAKSKRRRDERPDRPRDGARRPACRTRDDGADRGPRREGVGRTRAGTGAPSGDGGPGRKRSAPARPAVANRADATSPAG